VLLKSGGSLIIDQGEALTAIDVNTGKFVGKKSMSLEETITKTNLEAAKEVADQLRLRNIGGMIIVDFIDMDKSSNREKVLRAFEESLKADKAKANVTKISELGLVEMTRKRTRESLGRMLTEPCAYCEGKGYVKSKTTVCAEILRRLRRDGNTFRADGIVVTCNPEIADLLVTVEQSYLEELEKKLQRRIIIAAKKRFHVEKFELSDRRDDSVRQHRPEAPAPAAPSAHSPPLSPLDVAPGPGPGDEEAEAEAQLAGDEDEADLALGPEAIPEAMEEGA
jgi:ribonuclease G